MVSAETIAVLQQCIAGQKVAIATYRDTKGQMSERNLEPREIRGDEVFCIDRKDRHLKRFKLAGFLKIFATELGFEVSK